ncbi:DUF4811 domain-containing protein [Vagococcus bubulae]|uniref:DUF4811 domain-containing protein n=1 Tax=Vagococcus bubulae TaxID=1977868 RepID=A0A429ZL68_9ENTE|nr:DUF4811 domain-containing protein [Vagococcus bubulae]RST94444.1 hypothetical protein CBF36_05945 [Vagococcus bubulae]
MIVVLVILSALLFAFTFIFAKSTWQYTLTAIFGILFIGSIALMEMNYSHHFGMKKEYTLKEVSIVSLADSDQLNLLLYQPLGTGEEKVYLYKTKPSQKKVTQTGTNHVTNTVKTSDNNQAILKSNTTRWVYKNSMYQLLFGISGNNKEYISRENTFYIPKDWLELSTDQAKKLGEEMANKKDSLETETKDYVSSKLKEAVTKDPTLATNKDKQSELSQKYATEYQQKIMSDIIKDITK